MIQLSIFNFQLSIQLRRTNYILFIFIGVMCHVSTIIFNFQLSISKTHVRVPLRVIHPTTNN